MNKKKGEINDNIKNLAISAQNLYNQQKYIESYNLYKSIYKLYGEIRVIPNLIDIAFISTKKNLIRNRSLKFKLINALIDFGLSKDNETSLTNELIYLKLKLLREFKFYNEFNDLYLKIQKSLKNVLFVQFEYLHYLLETDNFNEAEITLSIIKNGKKNFYKNLDYFFIDKDMYNKIVNHDYQLNHNITFQKKEIQGKYNYIVVVSGTYNLFESEIEPLIKSLNKTSNLFMAAILIHDSNEIEQKEIIFNINKLNIENYLLIFESSISLNLDDFATKTYYTARRFILVNDLMEEYNCPIFLFDADCIICKDLNNFLEINKNKDMTLHIKEEIRYFQTALTANQSLFINTKNSKIFLNFYKKYFNFITKNKNLRWHVDQIILYISYILLKRFFNASIGNNAKNNYRNKDSFFYHTFHNKYLL